MKSKIFSKMERRWRSGNSLRAEKAETYILAERKASRFTPITSERLIN